MTTPVVPSKARSVTDWAREHGEHFSAWCQLDNHEPAREHASLTCHRYSTETVEQGVIIEDASMLKDARSSLYLLDDGRTIRPYYVAAWHAEGVHLILHPMPTNYNDDGSRKVRPDNGREVDFADYAFGPRRTYHLKVRVSA